MKDQRRCEGSYYYIDAFAGPGEHEIRSKNTAKARNPLLDVASFGQSQEEQRQFLLTLIRVLLSVGEADSHTDGQHADRKDAHPTFDTRTAAAHPFGSVNQRMNRL